MTGQKRPIATHGGIGFHRLRVMNRPRLAFAAGILGLGLMATACQLPTATGASKSKKDTVPGKEEVTLVPFAEVASETPEDGVELTTSVPDSVVPDTEPTEEIEAEAVDTTPSTTDASQNPICKNAKRVVDLNTRVDKGLNKAVTYKRTSSVLRALRALPVTDLRNAYDDLSAELNTSRRRRLAVVRDYFVDVGMGIVNASSIAKLSETMASFEGSPRHKRAMENQRILSKYIKGKCDFALTVLGDSNKKKSN